MCAVHLEMWCWLGGAAPRQQFQVPLLASLTIINLPKPTQPGHDPVPCNSNRPEKPFTDPIGRTSSKGNLGAMCRIGRRKYRGCSDYNLSSPLVKALITLKKLLRVPGGEGDV